MSRTKPFSSAKWAILLLLTINGLMACAAQEANGRAIYRQQCARCHGKNGEGVQGKFDQPLLGDRSLEKLTRYIDRAMPDDDPDKCVGENAAAVARFIYDAFYSREARLRKNPPRIELVHLTNRQYVHTVADLLKAFQGSDARLTNERGLRASYYHARGFDRNRLTFERLDRQLKFDFGEKRPDGQPADTNGFSIRWSGVLIADETGDYEIFFNTPNGARLWLNETDEPLIDASVASASNAEHHASVRLLGGRTYALRVEMFKAKERHAAISLEWTPPLGTRRPIPTRNLAPVSATPTLVVRTRFPADDRSVGYERGTQVSKAWDEATTQAALEVSEYVAQHLDTLSRSKPSDTNRLEKLAAFCTEFVAEAFRRPLTEELRRSFVLNHFKPSVKVEDSVKRVVLKALKSPRFLYLGLAGNPPDDYEVATRLSFGLWDSLPDAVLRKAAEQGKLRTREQIAAEARRMLADPRAHAKLLAFFHHWLQMDNGISLAKDAVEFPGFTPDVIADLRTSLDLFLEDTIWNGTADYRDLLLAGEFFVNRQLASFYGINTNMSDDFIKVEVDTRERSGVLTHPYLLAAFSYARQTSPIHRGVFLTRNIVGRALKPPPMAVAFNDAEFAANLTMREKVVQLTSPPACQGCHSVINPLGFSLEHFDAVGRYRKSEGARPINAASDFAEEDGAIVRLTGARDVAEYAIRSESAQSAFIEQLFHQVVKQPMLAYGGDVMPRLRERFLNTQFNVQTLLAEIAVVAASHGLPSISPANKKS